ncbi:MAG: 16S rRNA (cytosine(1402)-N(4))-methyltransferase RsmH [Dehalococcoidia bacterium]|nr:16S rRNA (cytosine(1402)-N(4))-methyltransferase RsmH [Chloroflexota bacterium]MCK4242842.1 16S rRNA (cytosine(1402)-N(4))-methyltransferase RsmH [Dehalococcoidia bacterium]
MEEFIHIPVLRDEVIDALLVQPGGRYIDCTVGQGGHASAILEHSSPGGQLLGIDLDPQAIAQAKERLLPYGKAAFLINNDYKNLEDICSTLDFQPVHGILFDLGLSSFQLANTSRGFSFRFDAPLDMRFNPAQELTAATIVNTFSEQELVAIIANYGEERRSRRIARSIVASRPINTTLELAAVVQRAVGIRGRIHPATKTFQALRIAVNQELEHLKVALEQTVHLLGFGGRLVAISYHSLEDRLVKEYLNRESRDCICPPRTPVCVCGHKATLRLIDKKPIVPSPAEIEANPRSRSAKMRVAERI